MKKLLFIGILSIFVFAGAGCIQISGTSKKGTDGGVYVSVDKGQTWVQSNAAPTALGVGTLNGISAMDLVFDPQDNQAIYLASAGTGLFYTWDGAKSWFYVEGLGEGYVNSVAVDPNDKCTIYAALQNKVWKSTDCARSWKTLYYDTRTTSYVSYIAVDSANSKIIYAGLSVGDLLKSTDAGVSWATIERFGNKVQKILINPKSSGTILVALETAGLWKSADSGKTWTDLSAKIEDFRDASTVYDLDIDKDAAETYFTSAYGILKSDDFGATWAKLDLLTPPGSARIYSFAVNPENSDEIYYATATTFYSSANGGKNWTAKKLPTSRAGTALLVDPEDSDLIYMGTRSFAK